MKGLIIFLTLFLILLQINCANSVVISTKNSGDYTSTNAIYSNDLTRVEKYLFGMSFKDDTVVDRFNRIEKRLFNKTYKTLNYAQRMNNILANYKDDFNNKNYLSEYYSTNTPTQRIRNRFIGQPTGFTPPIMPYPAYAPQYNRGYTTTRGYGYPIPQTVTRAGVRILD
jgi:hypothetical protein